MAQEFFLGVGGRGLPGALTQEGDRAPGIPLPHGGPQEMDTHTLPVCFAGGCGLMALFIRSWTAGLMVLGTSRPVIKQFFRPRAKLLQARGYIRSCTYAFEEPPSREGKYIAHEVQVDRGNPIFVPSNQTQRCTPNCQGLVRKEPVFSSARLLLLKRPPSSL